ncbi:hypothetical protein NHP164001_21150 [Helicobacter trogontum]|uniref:Uncharacterized protein n=1 Tax=Helicobacter trogontum TaxID=50960 RepID=A0ABQ0D6V8_9HELI
MAINGNNNIQVNGNNNSIVFGEKKIVRKVIELQLDPDIHITPDQRFELQKQVKDIHDFCKKFQIHFRDGVDISNTSRDVWWSLKTKMKVNSYREIEQDNFNKAVKHLKFLKKKVVDILKDKSAKDYKEYMIPKLQEIFNIKKSQKGVVSGCDNLLDFTTKKTGKVKTNMSLFSKDDIAKTYTALINIKG